MGSPRTVHRSFWRRFLGNRTATSATLHKRRTLRLEPLEQREMLAVADATGGVLRYTADAGERNDVVLSPGHFFSIQDADDVAQFGLGGAVPSDFLRGMSVSFGFEVFGVSVSYGFPLFVDTRLPDGTPRE